jgi:hypothetical protein
LMPCSRNQDLDVGSTRRRFLAESLLGGAAVLGSRALALPAVIRSDRAPNAETRRPRIALLATEVRKYSHAQHFIDRFLEGYGWEGRHYRPQMDLVSLYVDQFPSGDLARDRERRLGAKIYPSIAEALTLGGSKLAVDGVLIIAEHGSYPTNEKGQKRYPRHAFFKEIVRVFESSGRSVPVFNDKHLSTDWAECVEMVEDAKRLEFGFFAGSSLPVTWRIPAVDVPRDAPLRESVCVCYGGVDSYDIHGLETAQCMSERRRGGESGVSSIQAWRDANVWQFLDDRPETRALVEAALTRSHTIAPRPGYTFGPPTVAHVRSVAPNPVAYAIEHLDGFRTTLLLLNGAISDFDYAGVEAGTGRIHSCQMHLPMPPSRATLANFFSPLVRHIEELIITGKPPYPAERTLLTSGMVIFGVESLYRGEAKLRTPELAVSYSVDGRSTYWRT